MVGERRSPLQRLSIVVSQVMIGRGTVRRALGTGTRWVHTPQRGSLILQPLIYQLVHFHFAKLLYTPPPFPRNVRAVCRTPWPPYGRP